MANETGPYITVYKAICGWKAVMVWWNPGGFWEPYQTGIGFYDNREEAVIEAKKWAEGEGIEFKPGGE